MQNMYGNPFIKVIVILLKPSEFQILYFILLFILAVYFCLKWKLSPNLLKDLDNPNINQQTISFCFTAIYLAPILYIMIICLGTLIYKKILYRNMALNSITDKVEKEKLTLYLERMVEVHIVHTFVYKTIFLFLFAVITFVSVNYLQF